MLFEQIVNAQTQMKVAKKTPPDILNEKIDDMLPFVPTGFEIPKLIHQTFPNRNELPGEILDNIERIKAMNPGWEYRLYDDEDIVRFIKDNYDARILSCYLRINPAYGAARADLFRYLCIYKYGGVYIDIKSTLHKPLDSVIRPDDRFLISQWKNKTGEKYKSWGLHYHLQEIAGGEFQQWHIVAAKGHPYLRAVLNKVLQNIETYDPFLHDTGFYTIWATTGPIAYTLAIAPILDLHPHRCLDIFSEAGFEYSIYDIEQGKLHYRIFKRHYTSSYYKPVIGIGFYRNVIWHAVKFIRVLKSLFIKKSRV